MSILLAKLVCNRIALFPWCFSYVLMQSEHDLLLISQLRSRSRAFQCSSAASSMTKSTPTMSYPRQKSPLLHARHSLAKSVSIILLLQRFMHPVIQAVQEACVGNASGPFHHGGKGLPDMIAPSLVLTLISGGCSECQSCASAFFSVSSAKGYHIPVPLCIGTSGYENGQTTTPVCGFCNPKSMTLEIR